MKSDIKKVFEIGGYLEWELIELGLAEVEIPGKSFQIVTLIPPLIPFKIYSPNQQFLTL